MESFKILAFLCITSSSTDNVADCRRLPMNEWRAATDESFAEGRSADEIMNGNFSPIEDKDDDRSLDEQLSAAGTPMGGALAAAEGGEVNFGMDMNMDPGEYAATYGGPDGGNTARMSSSDDVWPKNERLAGTGLKDERKRWPNNIIPYKIGIEFNANERAIIMKAMQMWMNKTCIRFTDAGSAEARSAGHSNFIRFKDGTGCWTYAGYLNGRQDHVVNLQRNRGGSGCMFTQIVAHELGHVIGLHHEQNRNDRDNYIQIDYSKVAGGKRLQFQTQRGQDPFGTSYDYCSIMHYGAKFFTMDNSFTMIPKDLRYIAVIGEAKELTYSDATIVNKMYKCKISVAKTPCKPKACKTKFSETDCKRLKGQHRELWFRDQQ